MSARRREPASSRLTRRFVEELMFGAGRVRRFTQDTPVLPDVWLAYADCLDTGRPVARVAAGSTPEPNPAIKLLVTPWRMTAVGEARSALRERLAQVDQQKARQVFEHPAEHAPRVVYNQTTLAATLYFEDLVRALLPMTEWWAELERRWNVAAIGGAIDALAVAVEDPEHPRALPARRGRPTRPSPGLLWMIRVVGALALHLRGQAQPWERVPPPRVGPAPEGAEPDPGWRRIVAAVAELVRDVEAGPASARIFSVSLNREVTPTVARSVLAVKADAARQLFDISCAKLAWAVIDSGIDATHPAFRARTAAGAAYPKPFAVEKKRAVDRTRVVETYDFTEIDLLLDPDTDEQPVGLTRRMRAQGRAQDRALESEVGELGRALRQGRSIDWQRLAPLLRVPHATAGYVPPGNDHGTHVAGILAGDWRAAESGGELEESLVGVAPDLRLFDLRVLDADGRGDEFAVMAALQFVRHLNAAHDYTVVHGVNLSLSIPHDVANYACGRTPVCEECERVVASGVVVVAAAGNQGYRRYVTAEEGVVDAYNASSITDPGNAQGVITVGATHRYRPHTYGVSYFSSRGPTGDGRRKPDLVAPGEKITAPLPDALFGLKDGTSMAAPHVSGGAALLMARHLELAGQPVRVKEILCSTATDLGREPYFQGAGMLDVLRALQSL